jgi:hypothetical protein
MYRPLQLPPVTHGDQHGPLFELQQEHLGNKNHQLEKISKSAQKFAELRAECVGTHK